MARRWRWRVVWAAVVLALLFSFEAPGRRMAEERAHRVYVVNYGFHVGIALERRWFGETALFAATPPSAWVEIGWGEERFFRETPNIEAFSLVTGLRALTGLGETVVHVSALPAPPDRVFNADALTAIDLDAAGARLLAEEIAAAFAQPVEPLGEGHWPGVSHYYRSKLPYHLGHVCNHWASNALNRAGLPSSSFWSTLPHGLIAELAWRGRP